MPGQLGWDFQVPVGVKYLQNKHEVLSSLLLRVWINVQSLLILKRDVPMLKPKGQTGNWYMGFIFGHSNEHFCFILFYFPLISVYHLTCCCCSLLLMCCAAQGLLTPSKRDCQSWSPSVVSAVCSSRQYVFLTCVIIQTPWLLLWGVLSFFLKLHNTMVISKGKVLN